MPKIIPYPSEEAAGKLASIVSRRMGADPVLESKVLDILHDVGKHGDAALVRYTRRFDAPEFEAAQLKTSKAEMSAAYEAVDRDFLKVLREAISNIETFHRQQQRPSHFIAKPDGTFLGQVIRPVDGAGLYIPGGTGGKTPLISSVLMNGIPARLAGVKDIALITPPRKDGSIDPHLLVAASEVGITRIHKAGSAWGIAALAYGTESIARVDMIVGPGNMYVALAKKLVAGQVGIDLLAGPSEILVIAGEKANPKYIAADLLSQAEHDPMASAVLIATAPDLAERVRASVEEQIARLPRREIASLALQAYGAIFLVKDMEQAIDLANRIAPEHLELHVDDPWSWIGKIKHAGAIFLGEWTPEAVGDYFAGPNHVLPTAGTARFASALGVENFQKKTSLISYSREAFKRDAGSIVRLAELEGLEAHAASVRVRMEN